MTNGKDFFDRICSLCCEYVEVARFQQNLPSTGSVGVKLPITSKIRGRRGFACREKAFEGNVSRLLRSVAGAGCRPGQWYYEDATSFEPDPTPPRLTL